MLTLVPMKHTTSILEIKMTGNAGLFQHLHIKLKTNNIKMITNPQNAQIKVFTPKSLAGYNTSTLTFSNSKNILVIFSLQDMFR